MGTAVCDLLVQRGYAVIGIDSNTKHLEDLQNQLSSRSFTGIACDLRNPDFAEKLIDTVEQVPALTGLVNLAGISRGNDIEHLLDQDWEASFQVNADAPMKLTRLCVPAMQRAGHGSIVNVSSPVGLIGARKPSYAASKAALLGLTMSLARNLGPYNIRVNMLLPGATITYMTDDWPSERRATVAAGTFLGRLSEPREIATVIAFLISPEASYMTGSVVDVTAGGMVGH
mgnify:CR=1 FL=1